MNPQRKWQLKMREMERCQICGKKSSPYNVVWCEKHRAIENKRRLARYYRNKNKIR